MRHASRRLAGTASNAASTIGTMPFGTCSAVPAGATDRSTAGFSSFNSASGRSMASAIKRHVRRRLQLDGVVFERLFHIEIVQAVILGVLADDRHRQDRRNIVGGLLGQNVQPPQLPEIREAGALDGMIHASRTAIIRRHRQIPVTEMIVEVMQMPGRGARCQFRVHAIVGGVV